MDAHDRGPPVYLKIPSQMRRMAKRPRRTATGSGNASGVTIRMRRRMRPNPMIGMPLFTGKTAHGCVFTDIPVLISVLCRDRNCGAAGRGCD